MKKGVALFILLITAYVTQAQQCLYSGVLKDKQTNEPIPYASVYISSASKGVMTNAEGEYRIELPCGEHKAKIQSLAYETLFITLEKEQIIFLSVQSNIMAEVTVSAKAEDPAYYIMRKAIILSEYYKKQIAKYECDIYLKELSVIDKTPDILKLFATKENIEEIKTGSMSEVYLNYSFERPNIINEHIISRKTSYADTATRSSSYLNLNFYTFGGNDIISPLSKNAFQVYRFHLEESYKEGNITVRKIKLIPKRAGNDLMSGYLYINEGLWNINRVDVQFKQNMIDVSYKQLYTEVQLLTWFPISHEITVKASILGFEGYYKYLASISDVSVENDPVVDEKILSLIDQQLILIEDANISKTTSSEKLTKTQQKINEMMAKDNLTKAETLKMIRLIEKEAREEEKNKDEKPSLEVERIKRTVDYADSAHYRSAQTWDTLRAVPLTELERTVYAKNDSIRTAQLNREADTTKSKKRSNSKFENVLFGQNRIRLSDKIDLNVPGIFRVTPNFNTVDGLLLEKRLFTYSHGLKNSNFNLEPIVRYSFARNDVMYNVAFNYNYAPLRRAKFSINAGKLNEDFNNNYPFGMFLNSVSTLFFIENISKIYQKQFIQASNTIDISNGLELLASFEYAQRTPLINHSDYRLIKNSKTYTSNLPFDGIDETWINQHTVTKASLGINYTPKYFYEMRGKQKVMLNSNYPTFSVNYTHGINNFLGSNTGFSLAEIAIKQSKKWGVIDNVNYYLGGGTFLQQNDLKFADFKHFSTMPFFASGSPQQHTFRLLNYYQYSSNNYFLQAHVGLEDNVILFKRLPYFNRKNWTESLRVSFLHTEQINNYMEVGYGLNKVFLFMNFEFYCSFDNFNYQQFGFRMVFNNLF